MTEVKQMYKIVRFVNSDVYHKPRSKIENKERAIIKCAELYSSRRPWRNSRKAADWLENAYKHKFVRFWGDEKNGYGLKVEHGRGQQLIARKFPFRRVGLRELSMKEYPISTEIYKVKYTAIIGLLGIVLGSVATYLITS